jgi:ubiquinone/menaquinone biosynthesis C-methylase UbiE
MAQISSTTRLWKKIRKHPNYALWVYQIAAILGRKRKDWQFMNYGYVPLTGEYPGFEVANGHERIPAQMYHYVASGADLRDRDLLEVGCGRGGGAALVHQVFGCRSTTGLDLSPQAIAFCQRTHRFPGLSYLAGTAQKLPFPDASFDAVINIESSHLYPDLAGFYAEVGRVLKPGGHFLYADEFPHHIYPSLKPNLEKAGLTLVEETDIGAEVMKAMVLEEDRKMKLIRELLPSFLVSWGQMFAGTIESYPYQCLSSGHTKYFRMILRRAA